MAMQCAVQLEFWGGLKALPWILKPVYGILSDAVPLLGYHRRSYLIIFGLLGKDQRPPAPLSSFAPAVDA